MGEDLKSRYHVTKEGEIYRINDDGSFTDLGNAEKLGASEQQVGKQESQLQESNRFRSAPSKTGTHQKLLKKNAKPKEDDAFSFVECLWFIAFWTLIIWGIIDAIW